MTGTFQGMLSGSINELQTGLQSLLLILTIDKADVDTIKLIKDRLQVFSDLKADLEADFLPNIDEQTEGVLFTKYKKALRQAILETIDSLQQFTTETPDLSDRSSVKASQTLESLRIWLQTYQES